MSLSELVDHGETASTPIAHNRRSDGNPPTQNRLQEGPYEVPPPPAHMHADVDSDASTLTVHEQIIPNV